MNGDEVVQRVLALGLALPAPTRLPVGVDARFPLVRIVGNRALISGHGPVNADGTQFHTLGKVGHDLDLQQAFYAAQSTALAVLGNLKIELGSLDRITAWGRVTGMVNAAPDFDQHARVLDGFSNLIHQVFLPEVASHCRAEVSIPDLPMSQPLEIEAEVDFE